jgi:response regulator RpfG family c-di-GMP phosphodiesterase
MSPPEKIRVLIVDDEQANLDTMQRSFRKDLTMVMASSGREAIEQLHKSTFDVVLTDYAMPLMNGIELLRQASVVQPSAGRIMVTAHSDLDEVRAAKSEGLVTVVLVKPWKREEVLRWIEQLRGVVQMRRSIEEMNAKLGKPQ